MNFFKNLVVFRLAKDWVMDAHSLAETISSDTLQACGNSEARSVGWLCPRDGGQLVHSVNGQWLLSLGFEEKLLPTSVVRQFANEKAKEIEEAEDRRVGRKEMKEIREQMTLELLPRAFVRRHVTAGWIDPTNGWLVVDAASLPRAEEFLERLHKSVDRLPVKLLKINVSPSAAMTGWVASGEAPDGFTIDQDLELRSAEKATVRYAKQSLDGDDIHQHIAHGKVSTRLAMTWQDKISFVLTEHLQIRRLTFLDILKEQADQQAENEDERFDLDFTLMAGELSRMLDDLVEALGGEAAA